ncbi:hypothetical protein SNEBB_000025 [Seison nebaliae]|nr:hypothetical protein SNEBB_000025 [Seison nebaliae]
MFKKVWLFSLLYDMFVNSQLINYSHTTLDYQISLIVDQTVENGYTGCANECVIRMGPTWSTMILPDLHFLYYLDRMPRNRALLLGLCRRTENFVWEDEYENEILNTNSSCELWLDHEPDDGHSVAYVNIYGPTALRTKHYGEIFQHSAITDYVSTLNFRLACTKIQIKKLEAKFKISNQNRELIAQVATSMLKIDYKLIYGFKNCFTDVHLQFPEGNATLLYKDFDPTQYV